MILCEVIMECAWMEIDWHKTIEDEGQNLNINPVVPYHYEITNICPYTN